MSNEIKTLPQEKPVKKSDNLPVLFVDKNEEIVSEKEQQETNWHEIKNAYITKRILTGNLVGMEKTPHDNHIIGVTYYNGYKIIIPASELIELANKEVDTEVRYQKIISSMIGAEISYMIIALDNNSQTLVASRLRANARNRQTFFFDKDDKGKYKIYENSLVEARIIGVSYNAVRVEIFGVECTIQPSELSWDWITDVCEKFSVGDRVMVRITEIHGRGDKNEPLSIGASIRLAEDSKQTELLKNMSPGSLYTGQVLDIRKGTYLIKLSNGANALSHSSYCRKPVMRLDTIAFVVNSIDNSKKTVNGSIIRIVKSAKK